MKCAKQLLTKCYTETSTHQHFTFLIMKPTFDQTSIETNISE